MPGAVYIIYLGDGRMSLDCHTTTVLLITVRVTSHFRYDSFFFRGLTGPHCILCFDEAKGCKNLAFFCLSCYCLLKISSGANCSEHQYNTSILYSS